MRGNNAKIQAGAGIVHDSIPKGEYIECENKAGALISALNDAGHKNLDSKNTSRKGGK